MRLLIFSLVVLLFTAPADAQRFELGFNGGLSTTSRPEGSLYQGTDNVWNYAADISIRYGITERWRVGFAVNMTQWQREGLWPLSYTDNEDLGDQQVRYVLAKPAVGLTFQFHHVLPFFDRYGNFLRSELYAGASAGGVIVGNDQEVIYGSVNPNSPAEYRYAREFHFGSGYGWLLGAQIGYTYFVSQLIGINVEFAPKVAWVGTIDGRYDGGNQNYALIYFPTTVGVHFRFGSYY